MAADDQSRWMKQALTEARKGQGLTRPNPPVGAVLVKNNKVVGAGWHRKAGGPHAEVDAIRDAGEKAKGADLYVTLEPCSTFGKTPPCTQTILDAGICRVVVGCLDPNPKHAGAGIQLLQEAGVQVETGILEEECRDLIRAFETVMLQRRPRVVLKLGVTMDGRIADAQGKSQWITGAQAREKVQDLRRESDAILVGQRTLASDNPSLLPRPARRRKPYRVVVDSGLLASLNSKIYTDDQADQTLVFCGKNYPEARRRKLEQGGVTVHVAKTLRPGWAWVLKILGEDYGCLQVLCEGGGELADSLIRTPYLDEVHWMMAPSMLGAGGIPAIGGKGFSLKSMPEFEFTNVEPLGRDLWITAQPKKG